MNDLSIEQSDPVIVVQNVSFAYDDLPRRRRLEVMNNVSFSVRKGEFVSVLGPSGCGKTTLLRLIAGLLTPTSGKISVSEFRPRFGYVFQTPNLLPWLRTSANISLPLRIQSRNASNDKDDGVTKLLRDLGLAPDGDLYPWQLSLGMQMRANLGRALVNHPNILLFDEPFSALDAITALRLQRDVLQIRRKLAATSILVTHNIADAVSMSDRVVLLSRRPASVLKEYEMPRSSDDIGPRVFDSELDYLAHQILNDMRRESDLRNHAAT